MSGSADSASVAPDLLSAVSQAYELTAPLRVQRLSGGYANDVFLLDGAQPVVLHIKHPPLDLESLSWEHQLQQLLGVQLPEVPAPLPARDGRTFLLHQQRPVWLTPYVSGVPAGLADRRAVAAGLGRLHSIRIDVPARPGHQRLSDLPIPPIRQMPAAFDSWLPLIAQARSDALEVISHIAKTRSVAVGVTHNDIFPGNVLVENAQLTALLDWEEADIDWLVWDLASSIGPFCSTSDGALDGSATQDFIDSYRAAGGRVPIEEDDLIIPLMRIK
ncbi:MAG TPA: phosphotransferase, partial [Propionibacteriaceae bacterium]|nr:phosphotransferase [Propionibacteriaceae bacterium]